MCSGRSWCRISSSRARRPDRAGGFHRRVHPRPLGRTRSCRVPHCVASRLPYVRTCARGSRTRAHGSDRRLCRPGPVLRRARESDPRAAGAFRALRRHARPARRPRPDHRGCRKRDRGIAGGQARQPPGPARVRSSGAARTRGSRVRTHDPGPARGASGARVQPRLGRCVDEHLGRTCAG